MKIVAISGALRKASTNTGLLRALKELAEPGIEIEIVTLHGIPLYDGDDEKASGKPQIVKDLDAKIRAADGVIIATPEYNFSIPGVLKNATDWLSRGSAFMKWKRTGILGSSEGAFAGTSRAQYHLRQNLQALQAIVMPKPEIFIIHNEVKFDSEGNLTDDETRERLKTWLTAFVAWVENKP
jgi:chromate reductase, NAD(P)H dehydrogenase (quinone)